MKMFSKNKYRGTIAIIANAMIALLFFACSNNEENIKPIIGAIRWDAWHGGEGSIYLAVQKALSEKDFHYRVPFFGEIVSDDSVTIDGSSQQVMDEEIELAAATGLDYWAFVTYEDDSPMSIAIDNYLKSRSRNKINFCLIAETGRWTNPQYLERCLRLIKEPGYQLVDSGRPLLYIFLSGEEQIKKAFGGNAGLRAKIDSFRIQVKAAGLKDPYIVIMDFDAQKQKISCDSLGCQAISCYAFSKGRSNASYRQLCEDAEWYWNECKNTGKQVIPIVMSGWDRRPRIIYPMPWETWQKPGENLDKYYETATPSELASHLRSAISWMKTNNASCKTQCAIIYAWNEIDEGGWLLPTIQGGCERLDSLERVLVKREND